MHEQYEHLDLERLGHVLVVTLNRPDKLNAINEVMHDELLDVMRTVDDDAQTSVMVLTGAGRGFCAGGDVTRMPGADEEVAASRREALFLTSRPLIDAQLAIEKPTIAMVNGAASGLGATLALFCDLVIAAESAHFSDSHVNVGLVAGDGGAVIWPLLVGIARAKEFLFTGDRMQAPDAERLGLVNHVVEADELRAFTLDLAQRIAEQPSFAVRATKVSINRHLRRAVEDSMDLSGAWQLQSLQSEEHKAAVKAFAERRKAAKSAAAKD
jgi:enoyl-CoA hydratase